MHVYAVSEGLLHLFCSSALIIVPLISSASPHAAVSLSIWPLEQNRSITFLMLFVITLQPSTRRERVHVFGALWVLIGEPWALRLKQAPSHPRRERNTNSREHFVYLRARTAACYVSERRGKNISCLWRYLLACSVWQCSRFAPAHSFHRLFIDFPYLCQPPQHARVNITPHGVFMLLRLEDTMPCAAHGLCRCLILNRQKDGVVNVKLAK